MDPATALQFMYLVQFQIGVYLVNRRLQNRRKTQRIGEYGSMNPDAMDGERWVTSLLDGHPERLKAVTRFNREQFELLKDWLLQHTEIRGHKDRKTPQFKLCLFLFIAAHGASFRLTREVFRCSLDTISRIFHRVLRAMVSLHMAVVVPATSKCQDEIEGNDKYFPFFGDCVGAVDGTLIHIGLKGVSKSGKIPFRSRKHTIDQNVFASVNFAMNFTCVMPGFEGAAHDCRVVRRAIEQGFKSPGPGKYFLADGGYSSFGGLFLTPYRKVRYHLREWGLADVTPKNAKELFNLRHASLRNVIERVFGVLKKRFKFLDVGRDGYNLKTQVRMVYAITALHNFLNMHGARPEEEADELQEAGLLESNARDFEAERDADDRPMEERRDMIAEMMWKETERYRRIHNTGGPFVRPW
jgi:hypothetical protein